MFKIKQLIKKKMRVKDISAFQRLIICALTLAFIYAGSNTLGRKIMDGDGYSLKWTLLIFCITLPLAFMVCVILLFGFDRGMAVCSYGSVGRICYSVTGRRAFYPAAWGLIFLGWLPGFLASYPGVYVIDNVFQIEWFLHNTVSSHHPVLHTYLLGACVSLGKEFAGSYEAGLAAYSVIQMLILSGIFAYTVKCLRGRLPSLLQLICVALYALMPYHAVSSFTATKDILYAGLFLLVVLRTYEIVNDPETFFQSPEFMVKYVVLVFLSCCFRNTGIYIYLCTIPVFLVICRKYRIQVLGLGFSCLILWGIFTGPVYRTLGVAKGSSAEIMSVPMQQMSRALLNEGEKLSTDTISMIKGYLPDYGRYAPRVADPVKDTFNKTLFDQNHGTFLKTWIKAGLSCPRSYIRAFLELNLGFWFPQMKYPDPGTYLAFIPYRNADRELVGDAFEDAVYIERSSYFPELERGYEEYVEDGGYQNVPVLSMLYSPGFYFWLMCFGIVLCIYKKRYTMAVPFAMLFLLWLTLMVSPVVVFRYAYPLIVCLPVMLAMMGKEIGKTQN